MNPRYPLWLTALAMLAFAANSVLCRLALRNDAIDPASFTGLRLLSGALMLVLILIVMLVLMLTRPKMTLWTKRGVRYGRRPEL